MCIKKIICLILVLTTIFLASSCTLENIVDIPNVNDDEVIGSDESDDEKNEIEDIIDDALSSGLLMSYDPEDYIGDLETFVYGLLINELRYIYDVFPACVQLSDSYYVYGLAYTDYSECYTNDDETEAYFMSGFLPFVGELDVPQEDFDSGLYIYDLEYEDEETVFIWKYQSAPFLKHCVVYGVYLQYGVGEDGKVIFNAIPYEREKCDTTLGSLYSYDDSRYLYDIDVGNYIPITGESLATEFDYDELKREINAIIEEQNANFMSYDVTTIAYTSQEAVLTFLLSLQEETFLGYSVDCLIEASQSLDPLECFRITPEGLSVIDIQEIPPEEPTALCKWLVGTACVIVAAVGMAVTIIAPLLPPPWPHIAGALGGAASGAAVDVFMQVVVDNETLGDVNWTRVCVSAVSGAISGLINPYMMKVGGAGGFFLDTGVDALIGGVENAAITWIEGGDSIEILHAFGAGFAIGAVVSAGLKGIVAAASTGIKKIAKTAKEIAEKLPPSVNRMAAKMVAPVKNIGQAIGDGVTKLVKKTDDVLFKFKYKISKKTYQEILEYSAKYGDLAEAPEALVDAAFQQLRKTDLFDASGNGLSITKKDDFIAWLNSAKNNELLGKYVLDGETVNIVKRNGLPNLEYDVKYGKVFGEGSLFAGKNGRIINFRNSAKKYAELWRNGDVKMPQEIKERLLEKYPGRTITEILEMSSGDEQFITDLVNIIRKESTWVLHEGIDGSISLVPRKLHDKVHGYSGPSHMGGKSYIDYFQQHYGFNNFDEFAAAAKNGFKIVD